MSHRITRLLAVGGGIALAASALVGCAPADTDTEANTDDGTTTEVASITVATYPVMSNAAIYMGIENGTFEKHGLDVSLEVITSGPDSVPLLLSGDLNFTAVDVPTALNAAKEGLGVVAVGSMIVGIDVDEGYVAVVADPDSGITDWKGLEGKKVGVNALASTATALISASMENVGADPSLVEWVQIAQPETIPALLAGQLDAANLAQPLLTAAEQEGFVQVGNPEQTTVPNVPTFIYITTQQFVDENPEVVERFQAAIQEVNGFANDNHDLAIAMAKTTTSVDPAILDLVTGFPRWGQDPLTAENIDTFVAFMVEAGLAEEGSLPRGADVVITFK